MYFLQDANDVLYYIQLFLLKYMYINNFITLRSTSSGSDPFDEEGDEDDEDDDGTSTGG